MPREPIVFEDEDHEGGEVSRPSLGQQVAGEAKQVEFTLTRRGRDFILRLGERVAYRGGGGPKSCRLGRVTHVDQARAPLKVAVRPLRPFRSRRLSPWRLLAPVSLIRPGTACRSGPPWSLQRRTSGPRGRSLQSISLGGRASGPCLRGASFGEEVGRNPPPEGVPGHPGSVLEKSRSFRGRLGSKSTA